MSCEFCKLGQEVNCPGVIFSGCSRDGTFCQYTTVKAMNAVSIPDYVDIAMVTAILCEVSLKTIQIYYLFLRV
jgi:D-arabinose 1-dehydrogenase-like Zn-dependent alcohol dehydrogenase